MNAMGKLKRPRHPLDPDADIDEDKDKRGERAWIPPTGCCSRGGGWNPKDSVGEDWKKPNREHYKVGPYKL